jgi:hypothetical protein
LACWTLAQPKMWWKRLTLPKGFSLKIKENPKRSARVPTSGMKFICFTVNDKELSHRIHNYNNNIEDMLDFTQDDVEANVDDISGLGSAGAVLPFWSTSR